MVVLFIAGFLFLAAGIGLLVRAVALPRARASAQLRHIQAYGFNADLTTAPSHTHPSLTDELARFAGGVGRFTQSLLPALKVLNQSQLISGGVSSTPEVFHGYRTMFALAVPALLIVETVTTGKSSALILLLVPLAAAAAWVLPASTIRRRAQSRLDRIDRALPELIDVLTATIEAGLGFAGSLQLVADRFDGPLGEELRLTLQEQTMGLTTDVALTHMLARCETPSMRAFVRAVQQGQTLGVSVGQMMRGVAIETRNRRRQLAHEKVQKAPVKLLFPLVFMIFPSLLVVILFPAVHQLLTELG